MTDGRLEGVVLKDRSSGYRDGTRAGWTMVKDRRTYSRGSRDGSRHSAGSKGGAKYVVR
jgi:ATP-dependent DNA ligase